MSKRSTKHSLSPAAQNRLNQHLEEVAEDVVNRAKRLNSDDDKISLEDIENALISTYPSLPPDRSREKLFEYAQRSRRPNISDLYVLMAGVIAAGAFILTLVSFFFNSSPDEDTFLLLSSVLALTVALLSISSAYSRRMEYRKTRATWLRLAERNQQRTESHAATGPIDAVPNISNRIPIALRFIKQWIELEKHLRRLLRSSIHVSEEIATDYPIGKLLHILRSEDTLDDRLAENIREMLKIRNQLVHGKSVDPEDIHHGLSAMAAIRSNLNNYDTKHEEIKNGE